MKPNSPSDYAGDSSPDFDSSSDDIDFSEALWDDFIDEERLEEMQAPEYLNRQHLTEMEDLNRAYSQTREFYEEELKNGADGILGNVLSALLTQQKIREESLMEHYGIHVQLEPAGQEPPHYDATQPELDTKFQQMKIPQGWYKIVLIQESTHMFYIDIDIYIVIV